MSPLRAPLLVSVLLAGHCATAAAQPQSGDTEALLRVGVSPAMLGEMNANDAAAAIDVWGRTIASSRGLSMKAVTRVFDGTSQIGAAIRSGQVDLLLLRIEEYLGLAAGDAMGSVFVGLHQGDRNEEFLLLARRDVAALSLAQLKGRRLIVLEGPRSGLARQWLETMLAAQGQSDARGFFGAVTGVTKASRAMLPVFFRQEDACLVTRSAFRTMVEMNPQVGRDLVAVASSPPLVTCVLLLRAGFAQDRQAVIQGLLELDRTPRGQQVLNLFGVERLLTASASDIEPARDVFRAYQRIASRAKVGR